LRISVPVNNGDGLSGRRRARHHRHTVKERLRHDTADTHCRAIIELINREENIAKRFKRHVNPLVSFKRGKRCKNIAVRSADANLHCHVGVVVHNNNSVAADIALNDNIDCARVGFAEYDEGRENNVIAVKLASF